MAELLIQIEQFLLMSEQDLIRTIQFQQNEINQLKGQLSRLQGINFEQKYRKALKEIHGIINANRQLKEELDKLKSFRGGEADSLNQIQKEEFSRTHQKLLKEKNQIYSQKEALQLENQKLRYSIAALEDTVAKLKNDKMALARQRQADERFLDEKAPEKGINGKKIERDQSGYRDKESELRRTIENYQQHHATISRANRRFQQENNELQNKIFNMETQFKNRLNEKDIELKELKSIAREEYQGQIATLRKEIAQYRMENSELSMKVQYYAEESQNKQESENLYEKQFLQTLRDLKVQMEPMSYQISELQEKNQFEKQQSLREKTSLQIKVAELESELERFRDNQKMLEQKIVRESEKNRKFEETQKTIRKLEEENRMLGGRVIVLESKEVALRNRNGDELEERVMEFQTRIQMLLNDKEAIGNTKNVDIHQLIALKAYIMELDGRLKQVVNQNEYALKKYRSYKEKCAQLIRELKQHDIAINSLKGKLQGYDRLVVKLQGELERAITINDNQMKAFNMKISETSITSIQIYKKKYEALVEKLTLQQKYSEQQIETVKLNYETKIVDLNLKLEQLSQIKDTIGLYKSKNEQLSNKLMEKENQLIEVRMTKINIPEIAPQPKINTKEIIQKLNDTISTKEAELLKLTNQLRSVEAEWKSKYGQIEQTTSTTIAKKNQTIQDKENAITELEAQLMKIKKSNVELEARILDSQKRGPKDIGETVELRKFQNVNSKITELQIQLETLQAKYEIEVGRVGKLVKSNQELVEANNNFQAEITRLKFEGKRIEKELKMELQEKEGEIRRLKIKFRQSEGETAIKAPQIDNYKINGLKMDLEMMESQYQQAEADKNRYYNRTVQMEREVSALAIQVDQLTYALERSKNYVNNQAMMLQSQKDQQIENLQYQLRGSSSKVRQLEEQINSKENQLNKIKGDYGRERQRMVEQIENKDAEVSRVSRQLSKLRFQLNSQEDSQSGLRNEFEYKLNRLSHDNTSLRDQIQNLSNQCSRLESQVKFLKGRQQESNNSLAGQEEYIIRLSNEIRNFQNREAELEEQIRTREEQISKIRQELTYYKSELEQANDALESKDSHYNKLAVQINGYRNKQIEWEMDLENKDSARNRLQSELNITRNQVSNLEQEIDKLQRQMNRLRYSQSMKEEQSAGHQATLEQKQMIISRLQGDLRIKTDHISELTQEIESKNRKIAELQNQSIRYRSVSTDFESEMMEKNSVVNRLNFELNAFKARYTDLETETEVKDNNWHNLNRELTALRSQLDTFQSEMSLKESNIDRYKREARELGQEIQRLNQEVFGKNSQINQLNQQIFRLKMEGQDKSAQRIFSMQNQIFRLKNKCSNLESDLEMKDEQLMRARNQASKVRANITTNRYSDDEYDLLQSQFFQLQKSLTEVRGVISEKDLEISQLEGRIQFISKSEANLKRRLQEETEQLEQELQNAMNRERQLKIKLTEVETHQMHHSDSERQLKEKDWGLHLYTNEVDRLNAIERELKEEVDSLKLKLSEYNSQEDRLMENLTIMTLTFAEVEALRQRMISKESEIKEVRKSLINFAGSIDEINRRSSLATPKDTTQVSIEHQPQTQKSIAIEEHHTYKLSNNYNRETEWDTNRDSSYNYGFQLRNSQNQPHLPYQEQAVAKGFHNTQNLSSISANVGEQRRLASEEQEEEEEFVGQEQLQGYGQEEQDQYQDEQYEQHSYDEERQEQGQEKEQQKYYEEAQEDDRKGSMIEGLQMQFNSKHQASLQHRGQDHSSSERKQTSDIRQQATITSQVVSAHSEQQHSGIIFNGQPSNIQYYRQPHHLPQPYPHPQMGVHGGPLPQHIVHTQPVLIAQRGAQPRINFGGSVHSSFEQGRNVSSQSSVQHAQYGQTIIRHPHPAYPVNMSR